MPRLTSRNRRRRSVCILLLLVVAVFLFFTHASRSVGPTPPREVAKSKEAHEDPQRYGGAAVSPQDDISIAQVLFVSCNRHDRSQDYWTDIGTASQCEVAPREVRESSPQCQALYTGSPKPPLPAETPAGALTSGACGSVVDSKASQYYRLHPQTVPTTAQGTNTWKKREEWGDRPVASAAKSVVQSPPLDALIWLGDAIYADKRDDGSPYMQMGHTYNTLEAVEQMWITQRYAQPYTAFRETCVRQSASKLNGGPPPISRPSVKPRPDSFLPIAVDEDHFNVFGTWDDHDMGKNDGGKEYEHKSKTQHFFLNFLGAPASDPRWRRPGVYSFHQIPLHSVLSAPLTDPLHRGLSEWIVETMKLVYEHAVCLILLDARSFRDEANAAYTGDTLGKEQWAWLEGLLQHNITASASALANGGREPCVVTLIANGIQIIMDEKPSENWGAFPKARDRLFGLLKHYRAERVAFLTGDIHMGEIGLDASVHAVKQVLGYPILEVTSSGLTHSAAVFPGVQTFLPMLLSSNRRVGIYVEENFATARLSFDPSHINSSERSAFAAAAAFANRKAQGEKPQQLQQEVETTVTTNTERVGEGARNPSSNLFSTLQNAVQPAEPTPEGIHPAALKALLERTVNLTLTVFSLQLGGQPRLRVTAPLHMLSHQRGMEYVDAECNPHTGLLYTPGAAAAAKVTSRPGNAYELRKKTEVELLNGTKLSVTHYPNTYPMPTLTSFAMLMQAVAFPDESVPKSLALTGKAIGYFLLLCGCTILVCVVSVVSRVKRAERAWARPRSWTAPRQPSSLAAPSASLPSAVALAGGTVLDAILGSDSGTFTKKKIG